MNAVMTLIKDVAAHDKQHILFFIVSYVDLIRRHGNRRGNHLQLRVSRKRQALYVMSHDFRNT
jgi:hypothetical protein